MPFLFIPLAIHQKVPCLKMNKSSAFVPGGVGVGNGSFNIYSTCDVWKDATFEEEQERWC